MPVVDTFPGATETDFLRSTNVDHANAARLAAGLSRLPGLVVRATPTNMLFVTGEKVLVDGLTAWLKEKDILVSGRYGLRLVTHMGVSSSDMDLVISAASDYSKQVDA